MNNPFFKICRHDLWGFIDSTGNEIVPPMFDYASDFCEAFSVIRKRGKYGILQKNGGYKFTKLKVQRAIGPNLFLFIDHKTGKYGITTSDEIVILEPAYERINNQSEGVFVVKKDGKCGAVNWNGEIVVPIIYKELGSFSEGLATASRGDGRYGFISPNNHIEIDFQFSSAHSFSFGLAAVSNHLGKYGFVDRQGIIQVLENFDWIDSFSEGRAHQPQEKEVKLDLLIVRVIG